MLHRDPLHYFATHALREAPLQLVIPLHRVGGTHLTWSRNTATKFSRAN